MTHRYKLVKKPYKGAYKYVIYRKSFFGLIWLPIREHWEQLAAEQAISMLKHYDEHKKRGPETIGYY